MTNGIFSRSAKEVGAQARAALLFPGMIACADVAKFLGG